MFLPSGKLVSGKRQHSQRHYHIHFNFSLLTQQVAYEGLFEADGHELMIDSYPADVAVAISDSLFGVNIEVFLTCDQEPVVAAEDSCVLFNLNFTNSRCVGVCGCGCGCMPAALFVCLVCCVYTRCFALSTEI